MVDVVIGGSPCQDLSLAGKRAGLAGARSGLYMEQIRIIKEMREADVLRGRADVDIRPRYMVWENVPGAFSTNGGKDFAAVIEEAIRVAEPQAPDIPVPKKGWPTCGCFWDELGGWSVAWRVLDAQFWGVPQRRRRIALIADFGGLSAPEILFVRKSVSGDIEPGKPQRKEAAGETGGGSTTPEPSVIAVDQGGGKSGANSYDGVAPTLTCTHGGEPAVVYGVTSKGNGDCFISEERHTSLSLGGGQAGQGYPCVLEPMAFADVSSTLRAGAGAPKHMSDILGRLIEQPILLESNQNNATIQMNGVCTTLPASMGMGGGYIPMIVRCQYVIRRLIPLECERLQGYPDNWTDIGEWVDSKGKLHKEADTPRYKALGNSIAIPPWKWVLKRLCSCYERDATMASLFDGIGGFPYIWEQINGKGSCLWASEIEEFPMAVTKLRFGG